MNLKIRHSFPTNEQFNTLFDSVGWGNRDDEKIDMHRQNSVFAVSIFEGENILGMARVVGDGSYYTVYDVVVSKQAQGKGVGRTLMEQIVEWYKTIQDDDTYLYLGASFGMEGFYQKFGFKSRPYGHVGAGMKYDPNE